MVELVVILYVFVTILVDLTKYALKNAYGKDETNLPSFLWPLFLVSVPLVYIKNKKRAVLPETKEKEFQQAVDAYQERSQDLIAQLESYQKWKEAQWEWDAIYKMRSQCNASIEDRMWDFFYRELKPATTDKIASNLKRHVIRILDPEGYPKEKDVFSRVRDLTPFYLNDVNRYQMFLESLMKVLGSKHPFFDMENARTYFDLGHASLARYRKWEIKRLFQILDSSSSLNKDDDESDAREENAKDDLQYVLKEEKESRKDWIDQPQPQSQPQEVKTA